MAVCRCGFDDTTGEQHKCHGRYYTCGNVGVRRLYNAKPANVSGQQLKFAINDT